MATRAPGPRRPIGGHPSPRIPISSADFHKENGMSQQSGGAKRSEKGLLTPDNCVAAFIDLQPQMLFGVANFDRQSIINNNVALAKAARVFGVPVVLSPVETNGFSG